MQGEISWRYVSCHAQYLTSFAFVSNPLGNGVTFEERERFSRNRQRKNIPFGSMMEEQLGAFCFGRYSSSIVKAEAAALILKSACRLGGCRRDREAVRRADSVTMTPDVVRHGSIIRLRKITADISDVSHQTAPAVVRLRGRGPHRNAPAVRRPMSMTHTKTSEIVRLLWLFRVCPPQYSFTRHLRQADPGHSFAARHLWQLLSTNPSTNHRLQRIDASVRCRRLGCADCVDIKASFFNILPASSVLNAAPGITRTRPCPLAPKHRTGGTAGGLGSTPRGFEDGRCQREDFSSKPGRKGGAARRRRKKMIRWR